jgi:polysaccharide biosynthesis/export protein
VLGAGLGYSALLAGPDGPERGGVGLQSMRVRSVSGRLAAVSLTGAVALAGCSTLPSSGPTSTQINRAQEKYNDICFTIVDIDAAATQKLASLPPADGGLAKLTRPGRIDTIGAGDVLTIMVYEVGVTLFQGATGTLGQGGQFNPAARSTLLDDVLVGSDGTITLPYVGRLKVADRTPAEVARMIERGLRGLSQRPQAQVGVKLNAHNNYYILGDVRAPGKFPLALPEERLIDALARAGGATIQPDDAVVRVTRDGQSAETRLSAIDAAGPQNIALLPGDRVQVFTRPRTFLAFGSTSKVSQVPFSANELSMAEALARIAGPNENSADAAAVYLFRYDRTADEPGGKPVIYRLNMLRAESYFLSQRIGMRDKDVIYVASAKANQPGKLAQILGQLFSPIFAIRNLTN